MKLGQKFVKFFRWYFGKFKTPKFYSEIIWLLKETMCQDKMSMVIVEKIVQNKVQQNHQIKNSVSYFPLELYILFIFKLNHLTLWNAQIREQMSGPEIS